MLYFISYHGNSSHSLIKIASVHVYRLSFRTRLTSCYKQSIWRYMYSYHLVFCCTFVVLIFIVKVAGLSRFKAYFYGLFGIVNHHLHRFILKCSHIIKYLLDKFSFLKHFHKWIKSIMCLNFYCIVMLSTKNWLA